MATIQKEERLLVKIPEAADMLSVSRQTIYDMIGENALVVIHIGRSARVTMASIRAWMEASAPPA